ncbi:MAG: winged helix-turn-helix transcriptional regulator [Marinifilaceae bacterium]
MNELPKIRGDVSLGVHRITFRSLEKDGLAKGTIYPVVPPKVEYEFS